MPPTRIAIAVVERGGRFLIGRRPEGVPLAGYWEFPGGKVHADEMPAEAARRECREEAGLEVTVVGEYPDVVHQYDHDRLRLYFFECRLSAEQNQSADDPPTPPSYRWVSRRELRDYPFPPANDALIALLGGEPAP